MPEGISNFDLSLSMKQQNDHLLGVLRYKTDLFPSATITRLLERFQALLGELVANPDQRLADLPRFSAETGAAGIPPAGAADPYVAPQTELEQTVATIWQTVLRREQISVEANFFAIGGRSLDLVQVGGKLQAAFDLEVPLKELFNRPTIRLLADYLSQQRAAPRSFARQTHDRTRSQRDALKRRQEQMQRRRKSNE
jgi:acyl carrier protein